MKKFTPEIVKRKPYTFPRYKKMSQMFYLAFFIT